MLLALCIRKPVASQMVRDGETLSVAWRHHDHHESIDIHRCSQNGHVCLNSALHKLILHVHVRCWDFTIVPVSALGVTLEDMGKMHQLPIVKLVGFLGRHVLLLLMRHDIEDAIAYGLRTRRNNHGGLDLTCVCSIVVRYQVIYSYHLGLTLWPYGNHKMVTGSVK